MSRSKNRLDYSAAPCISERSASKAFNAGDAEKLIQVIDSADGLQDALPFVASNLEALKAKGMYEPLLLHAVLSAKMPRYSCPLSDLERLLLHADREELRRAGDSLPSDGPIVAYRGVSGVGRERHVRGYSWTLSVDEACSFACEQGQAAPAVYRAVFDPSDVLCYVEDLDGGTTVVGRPKRCRRVNLSLAELRKRGGTHDRTAFSRLCESITAALPEPVWGKLPAGLRQCAE